MPEKALFAAASAGTIVAGITYKLRIGENLTAREWVILSIALAGWGLVAFGVILFSFPTYEHGIASALLSPPLGLGLSETFALTIASLQMVIKAIPELFKFLVEKWGAK